jgi:tyrosine-protein kinase
MESAGQGPNPEGPEGAVRPFFRALRSRVLVAITVAVAVVAGAVGGLSERKPHYEATAQVLVTPVPIDDTTYRGLPVLRESNDQTRTVQTAATLIDSRQAADHAAAALGAGWSGPLVRDAVDVKPEGQSNIIDITATAASSTLAARVANEFAAAALEVRASRLRAFVQDAIKETRAQSAAEPDQATPLAKDLRLRLGALRAIDKGDDPTLALAEAAVPPSSSSDLSPAIILAVALVAGLILAVGTALLLDALTPRRLADEYELTQLYPLQVLARLPAHGRRLSGPAGPPVVPSRVGEVLRTLQVQLDLAPGRHRTILLTSVARADGKTTTAIEFALTLAGTGREILLIDFDLREPDVANALGLRQDPSIATLLAPDANLSTVAVNVNGVSTLTVVTARPGADLPFLEDLSGRMPELLAEALNVADYIVIDTPPVGDVSDALTIAGCVDDVILVSRLGHTPRAGLIATRDLLQATGIRPSGHIVIGGSDSASGSYAALTAPPVRPSVRTHVQAAD